MKADDSRPVDSRPDGGGTEQRRGADRLSRRQALHRLGLGVAGGAAAWAAPEILIGRPTTAGAASEAPQGRGGQPASSGQSSGGSSGSSGTGQAGAATGSSGAASGSPASPTDAPPSDGGGRQLAFTGFDAERAVELGTGLLVGGWMLTRWSGRGDGSGAADDASADRPPQPS